MEKGKRELLKRLPTRKLVASIKKDIRKTVAAAKPKKKRGMLGIKGLEHEP
jgi:hypothetical protein